MWSRLAARPGSVSSVACPACRLHQSSPEKGNEE